MIEGIDIAKLVGTLAAGGPVTWVIGGVTALIGIGLLIWFKKMRNDLATKATREAAEKEQGQTIPVNNDASQKWEEASQRVDDRRRTLRDALKKP